MHLNHHGLFVLIPLFLVRLSAAFGSPRGASLAIHGEETERELATSTLSGSHVMDLGTIIHEKANLVLDHFIDGASQQIPSVRPNIDTWDKVHRLKYSKGSEQMENHPAFDMIARTFGYRALHLRAATEFEQRQMRWILLVQPPEIRETIQKIDQLCAIVFPSGDKDHVTGEKILKETERFRQKFSASFNGLFSKEIEQKMKAHSTDSKWMTPHYSIRDFHKHLIAIEEWNQHNLILKLHLKLDSALGRRPVLHLSDYYDLILRADRKALIIDLHPKIDQVIHEIVSYQGFSREPDQRPIEELDLQGSILRWHQKLDSEFQHFERYPRYDDKIYQRQVEQWRVTSLILKLHKKFDRVLELLPSHKQGGLGCLDFIRLFLPILMRLKV
ncbi:hypothetical protein KEM48_007877 [Puccinia striiformis f. sp. tritici PST-130]|nr:hypothetical protein KEM48_007877 [Puccinia striiformis f. sp. tritici PST-130]